MERTFKKAQCLKGSISGEIKLHGISVSKNAYSTGKFFCSKYVRVAFLIVSVVQPFSSG